MELEDGGTDGERDERDDEEMKKEKQRTGSNKNSTQIREHVAEL